MIRSSLRAYLLAQSGITDIIGTRLYPVTLPESAVTPAMTYARVSGGHDHNINRGSGTALPTFELDCWSDTYEGADLLAEQVRLKMQGFDGTMGVTSVKAVILDDELDAYEPPIDGSDKGVYRITLRYRIRYSETVPTP